MYLINEENRGTGRPGAPSRVDGVSQVTNSGGDCGEGHKPGFRWEGGGEGTGQGGLPAAGRAPKDDGGEELVRRGAKEGVGAEEVVLTENGVECSGSHPLRKRSEMQLLG